MVEHRACLECLRRSWLLADLGPYVERVATGEDYHCDTFLTPLSSVAKATRGLPDEYINDSGNNILDSFVEYVAPLVGELPRMGLLENHEISS